MEHRQAGPRTGDVADGDVVGSGTHDRAVAGRAPFGGVHRLTAAGLVGAQVVALAAVLLPAGRGEIVRRVPRARRVVAAALVLGGAGTAVTGAIALGPALTPSPLPTRTDRLRTAGPYRLVRHPAYAGLIAAAAGRALGTGSPRHMAGALALTGVFTVKARYEEHWLLARFPEYRAYMARTPRLLPGARGVADVATEER